MADTPTNGLPTAAEMADLRMDGAFAKAFNEGCDARHKGRAFATCPYTVRHVHCNLARYWKMGWRHVDAHWGELAPLLARPIPPADGRTKQPKSR